MTVAFASLMAILIIERIDVRKGTYAIVALIMMGIISNLYWRQGYFSIPSICIALFGHLLLIDPSAEGAKLFFTCGQKHVEKSIRTF